MRSKILLAAYFLLLLSLSVVGIADASSLEPGSKEDPLITKSYADKYIDDQIEPLAVRINTISTKVAALTDKIETLQKTSKIQIKLTIGSLQGLLGDKLHTLEASPFTQNGRTMVPFRFIGEALGAKIDWEPTTKTVSYTLNTIKMEFPIDSSTVTINGEKHNTDAPATLVNGRTFVPIRMISEHLGAKVDWNASTKEVTIVY